MGVHAQATEERGALLVPAICLVAGTASIVAVSSGHTNAFDSDVLRLGAWLSGPLAGAVVLDHRRRDPVGFVLAASGAFPLFALVVAAQRTRWLPTVEEVASPDLLYIVAVLAIVASVLWATRTGERLGQRQRRWLVAIIVVGTSLAGALALGSSLIDGGVLGYPIAALHVCLVAATSTVVLRQDLPDLGLAAMRLSLLTAATVVLGFTYVVALVSLSSVFPNHPGAAAALTALVAVGLMPVYAGLRDQLAVSLYGAGQRPDLAMTLLSQSLDTAGEAEDVLRAACEAVAAAVHSPDVTVALRDPAPPAPPGAITVLLQAGGQFLGTLVVAPRRPGESFSRRETDLVTTLAAPLAQVARAISLAAALETARRELDVQRLDERRRLRRDLHDGLGPLLAGLGLRLDALEREAPGSLGQQVSTLRDTVARSRQEVRRLVDGLASEQAENLDLEQSLRELVDGWASASASLGLRFEFVTGGPIPSLTNDARIALYRIAGEAITNVVRHARATTCVVSLRSTSAGAASLEVRDDGIGFRAGSGGFGLRSIEERAAAAGGTVEIRADEGNGTSVTATVAGASPPISA